MEKEIKFIHTREIKFSYILQHEYTFMFIEKIYSHNDIFIGVARQEFFNLERYLLVAKRQYTGLKDYNKVDIYEGDIVSRLKLDTRTKKLYKTLTNKDSLHYRAVQWTESKSGWNIKTTSRWVVVGNIYQNNELIIK